MSLLSTVYSSDQWVDGRVLDVGPTDRHLLPMTRVVGLEIGGGAVALPFPELAKRGVAQTTVGARPIVVFHLHARLILQSP